MSSTSASTPTERTYLSERLGATIHRTRTREVHLSVAAPDFEPALRELRDAGARFVTLLRAQLPGSALIAVLAWRAELVLVEMPIAESETAPATTLGSWWPAARWPEQELRERWHAPDTRDEVSLLHRLTRPNADRLDRTVTGLDAFAIPYGPVRSGIFEAIQFRIETGGETVAQLQTRPFFKHRGIERRFVGLHPDVAVHVAERVAGVASNAYASAFSHAIERAFDITIPPRAQSWRAVYGELERMACHLDVIAKEAETTALYVGQARFQILKERVQRLRARLTGSRFGRGVIVPGGVRAEGTVGLDELCGELDDIERDLIRDTRMFMGTSSMTDRLIGAGRLSRELIEEYGAVGPLARGSGVSTDARHERPYGSYDRLGVRVVTRRTGDAMGRINVRFGEVMESLHQLRQAIDDLRRRDGRLRIALPEWATGAACGWVEAPQGELMIRVEIRDGLIAGVHIASPSLRNWALFDHAFPSDVLTDFAFIEHSFGLTPAGADR